MSFQNLKPYFQDRMIVALPDSNEWEDAFNIENIPSTILDRAWHIDFGPFVYTGTAHTCLSFDCPVRISIFLKGYRSPNEAVDNAMIYANTVITEVCKPLNRLNQATIKNILPNTVDVRGLAQSNDNAAVLELSFDCKIIIGF